MNDIRCSREGIKCDGCPIKVKCDYIELTEEIDPYALYKQGRAEAIDECIKLFKEMQPRIATNVVEFGDMLEQLKEQK